MPSKHINDEIWKKIEDLTIKTVACKQINVSTSDMLRVLLNFALENISADQIQRLLERDH